jgi:hypothetical protein
MKAGTNKMSKSWNDEEEAVMNDVIYLFENDNARRYDRRRAGTHVKKNNGDKFWNVFFIGLCLSVLVVLFLH